MALVERSPRVGVPASIALAVVTIEAVAATFGGVGWLVQDLRTNDFSSASDLTTPALLILLGITFFRASKVLSRLTDGGTISTRLDLGAVVIAAIAHLVFFTPLLWFTVSDPVDAKSNVVVVVVAAAGIATGIILGRSAHVGRLPD